MSGPGFFGVIFLNIVYMYNTDWSLNNNNNYLLKVTLFNNHAYSLKSLAFTGLFNN